MRAKNEYKFIKEAYQSVIKEDTSRLAGAQAKKTAGTPSSSKYGFKWTGPVDSEGRPIDDKKPEMGFTGTGETAGSKTPTAPAPVAPAPAPKSQPGAVGRAAGDTAGAIAGRAAAPSGPSKSAFTPTAPSKPAGPGGVASIGSTSTNGSFVHKDKGIYLTPQAVEELKSQLEAAGLWPPSPERQAFLDSIK
jgi:hypothetical protein